MDATTAPSRAGNPTLMEQLARWMPLASSAYAALTADLSIVNFDHACRPMPCWWSCCQDPLTKSTPACARAARLAQLSPSRLLLDNPLDYWRDRDRPAPAGGRNLSLR